MHWIILVKWNFHAAMPLENENGVQEMPIVHIDFVAYTQMFHTWNSLRDKQAHAYTQQRLQIIFYVYSLHWQLKYLAKDEFKDLKSLKRIRLDGNQMSAIVDDLFHRQKSLEYLGEWSEVKIALRFMRCILAFFMTKKQDFMFFASTFFNTFQLQISLGIAYDKYLEGLFAIYQT